MDKMRIIDASSEILGRFATKIAKLLLEGEKIDVVNCERAVITGKENWVSKYYAYWYERLGSPYHGPYPPRDAHMLLRRTIRGMLPYEKARGKEAYKRLKCHIGVPSEFVGKNIEKLEGRPAKGKKITLKELSTRLGSRKRYE